MGLIKMLVKELAVANMTFRSCCYKSIAETINAYGITRSESGLVWAIVNKASPFYLLFHRLCKRKSRLTCSFPYSIKNPWIDISKLRKVLQSKDFEALKNRKCSARVLASLTSCDRLAAIKPAGTIFPPSNLTVWYIYIYILPRLK